VRVEVPARAEVVEVLDPEPVAEPVAEEPVVHGPPPAFSSTIFKGIDRNRLAALEAAARRELAQGRRMGLSGRLFGGKKR